MGRPFYVQSPRARQRRAREQRIFILLMLLPGTLVCGVGITLVPEQEAVFIQQKYFVVRARVQEFFPRAEQSQYVAPPLAVAVLKNDPLPVSISTRVVQGKVVQFDISPAAVEEKENEITLNTLYHSRYVRHSARCV